MLVSEPGTHKPVRTTWSFFLLIFSAHPSSPILPAAVFSRFRPQGVPHPPHPSLRPQTLVAFGYCSTVVPFSFSSPTIQHISQKDKSHPKSILFRV